MEPIDQQQAFTVEGREVAVTECRQGRTECRQGRGYLVLELDFLL